MVDKSHHSDNEEQPKCRRRCGSLANERALLDLLEGDHAMLQPTSLTLVPHNSNIYARRHSAHTCSISEEHRQPKPPSAIPPPIPLRPPPVPKRNIPVAQPPLKRPVAKPKTNKPAEPPPLPPTPKCRALPNNPFSDTKPKPPLRQKSVEANNINNIRRFDINRNCPKNSKTLIHEVNNTNQNGDQNKTVSSKIHKPNITANKVPGSQPSHGRVSIRQDSSISSDSFSQTSSPSYTTKTMETPLLPPKTPIKQQNGGVNSKLRNIDDETNGNATITKSASTPASLQAIVKFHNGSNMSLHHRIIRDIRRPSTTYTTRLKFRFAQLIINAVALFAIGAGMAAYFKSHPTAVTIVNKTLNVTTTPVIIEKVNRNPAPGVCLEVIVPFCKTFGIPYNYTVFPNYIGHFGQKDAEHELEVYDAIIDVRCYDLSALFLCSLFLPKCGTAGTVVPPCRSLCYENKKRCGFFLHVFGLTLPDYLDCPLFPESTDTDICIGYHEVREHRAKSMKPPMCSYGFLCDKKRCIPSDWKCDGHIDCKDQTDELNCHKCGSGMINCGANKCITQEHMCDGKVDCPYGQDERNCLRLSEKNGDIGKGQLEVYRPDREKWVPACVAHWDYRTSARTVCSLLGYSIANYSTLLKGINIKSPPIRETIAIWRFNQHKRPKNLIREFASCNATNYPTVELSCLNYMCGKARKSYDADRRLTRIVGGVRSKPGDWPFLAAILGGPEEIFYCAGVLIADQWVLTASHCVGNRSDLGGYTIQLGITRRHAHAFYGQKVKVKRVVPHPLYNLGVAHDNDVALFQLSEKVTFHEHLLPVCLPPPNKVLKPGTMCTVIGWGKKEDTGNSEYESEINEVVVPVLNRDLCNLWLEQRDLNVTDGMICAGYKEGGKDACQGDSGGPLLCHDYESKNPESWFVGGIVSWGIKCAHPHLPGVYAYVPKYVPWIRSQLQKYSQ